jgi:hypothetical protein
VTCIAVANFPFRLGELRSATARFAGCAPEGIQQNNTRRQVTGSITGRLLQPIGHVPPAEFEERYYRQQAWQGRGTRQYRVNRACGAREHDPGTCFSLLCPLNRQTLPVGLQLTCTRLVCLRILSHHTGCRAAPGAGKTVAYYNFLRVRLSCHIAFMSEGVYAVRGSAHCTEPAHAAVSTLPSLVTLTREPGYRCHS